MDRDDLDGFERLPAVLQPVFKVYGPVRREEFLTKVAVEMQIPSTPATYPLLDALTSPIATVVERRHRFLDFSPPLGLCLTAVNRLSLDETIQALVDLGQGQTEIRRPVANLEASVKLALATYVAPIAHRMFNGGRLPAVTEQGFAQCSRWPREPLVIGPGPEANHGPCTTDRVRRGRTMGASSAASPASGTDSPGCGTGPANSRPRRPRS
jgi:hypothetical protein